MTRSLCVRFPVFDLFAVCVRFPVFDLFAVFVRFAVLDLLGAADPCDVTGDIFPSVSSADAERPKLHRENAIFMVNGYSKCRPQKPSERETSFVNNGVNSPHTRRHSGSLRTAKVRPSDAFLPQMDEIEEVENESVS